MPVYPRRFGLGVYEVYPMVLPHLICLICIGNEEFTHERRMHPIPRKDVLKKHVETHFRVPEYQRGFKCRHPECFIELDGMMHFERHALDVHGVSRWFARGLSLLLVHIQRKWIEITTAIKMTSEMREGREKQRKETVQAIALCSVGLGLHQKAGL